MTSHEISILTSHEVSICKASNHSDPLGIGLPLHLIDSKMQIMGVAPRISMQCLINFGCNDRTLEDVRYSEPSEYDENSNRLSIGKVEQKKVKVHKNKS